MTEHDEKLREAVALFRYGLIADLVHLPRGARGMGGKLKEKAAANYTIPGTHRTRVASETIRHWLTMYRYGGFEALYPKLRSDLGQPRRMAAEVAEALVAIKTRRAGYSVRAVIAHAAEHGLVSEAAMPSPSTVLRLLRREGLSGRAAAQGPVTDRRRFNYVRAGQLWMSDVMHGPKVPDGRRRRKTFLIAFIDDATRVIPHAAFAFAENTAAFLPVFKHALLRRGLAERLYVDNGANYRSRQLALVCAKLGIALIHARPYQPAGKGKIERWFRTLRAGWLRHLDLDAIDGIEALNRALAGWIEGEYHQSPHRGLDGQTPLDRWAATGAEVRYPDAAGLDLEELFLFETKRRVMKDRTLSLHGRLYEADAILIGCTVTVRYDPAAPPSRALQLVHEGRPAGLATPLDAYANTAVKRGRIERGDPEPPRSRLSIRQLKEEQE